MIATVALLWGGGVLAGVLRKLAQQQLPVGLLCWLKRLRESGTVVLLDGGCWL